MKPYLRKVIHPQARDDDRVVIKLDEGEFEIGPIGIQHAVGASYFWAWGIETVIPMRTRQTRGKGKDRRDCMRQFKAAWERFGQRPTDDPERAGSFKVSTAGNCFYALAAFPESCRAISVGGRGLP